jgi:hypothetical protein
MEFTGADLSPCSSTVLRLRIRALHSGGSERPSPMGVVNYRRWASSQRIRRIGRGRAFGNKSLQGGHFGVSPMATSAAPSATKIPRWSDCDLVSNRRLSDAHVVTRRFETIAAS